MSKLVELLQELGAEAGLAKAYEDDTETVRREAGLSDEEMVVPRSVDEERIKKRPAWKSWSVSTVVSKPITSSR